MSVEGGAAVVAAAAASVMEAAISGIGGGGRGMDGRGEDELTLRRTDSSDLALLSTVRQRSVSSCWRLSTKALSPATSAWVAVV